MYASGEEKRDKVPRKGKGCFTLLKRTFLISKGGCAPNQREKRNKFRKKRARGGSFFKGGGVKKQKPTVTKEGG